MIDGAYPIAKLDGHSIGPRECDGGVVVFGEGAYALNL